jgi:large subunit ribosomal protein L16
MGKGKGNVDSWVCKVRPGSTLCEIKTIYKSLGLKALYSTQYRLPLKTKILKN